MTLNEYMGPNGPVTKFNKPGTSPLHDLLHGALGLVTELHEYRNAVDRVHKMEELGDLMWFATLLRQTALAQITEYSPVPINEPIFNGSVIARVCDIAKRWMQYGKAPSQDDWAFVASVTASIIEVIVLDDFDLDQVLQKNYDKLEARFGAKFSTDRAIDRDTANERKVLEQ